MIIREYTEKRKNSKKTDIKIEYKCDICNKNYITFKHNLKDKSKQICKDCSNKINGKLKRGKISGKKGKSFTHLQKENSPRWKGGRYINKAGYVMIAVKSGSVNRKSGWENYRPEHIINIEKHIGRKLTKEECVHHVDGNRQNNHLDNLALILSNEHHRKTHMSLQRIGYELYKEGKIKFNKLTNQYER